MYGRFSISLLLKIVSPRFRYHVPRSFLKPTNNLLVIFEETGGKPEKIRFTNVDRDTICSYVTEFHPPPIDSWEIKDDKIQAVAEVMKPHSQLKCPEDKVITLVEFASFGDPEGVCGHYTPGKCDYQNSKSVVEKVSLSLFLLLIFLLHNEFL